MDLARYWSGGCGVYHIIGELLAETAMEDPEFSATMTMYGRQPVTLLLSAGGGTGGGISGAFRQQPPDGVAALPNVRLFAVLPELDQFQDGGADISGPDGFQCATPAGSSSSSSATPPAREPGRRRSASADLVILSNSYLSCIPPSVPYQEGVRRLNRLLAHALVMMPADVNQDQFPARAGWSPSASGPPALEAGNAEPQPAAQVAWELVRTALTPVDLVRQSPTGLSALPMELNKYKADSPASSTRARTPGRELSGGAAARPAARASGPSLGVLPPGRRQPRPHPRAAAGGRGRAGRLFGDRCG